MGEKKEYEMTVKHENYKMIGTVLTCQKKTIVCSKFSNRFTEDRCFIFESMGLMKRVIKKNKINSQFLAFQNVGCDCVA